MATSFKSIERWLQRKRQNEQYKLAIAKYSIRLHNTFVRETQRELDKMASNTVDILVGNTLPDDELKGFTVANLPEIRVNETVSLVRKSDTNNKGEQVAARGSVVSAGADGVKVKLNKPLPIKKDSTEKDRVFRLKFDGRHIRAKRERLEIALRKFSNVSCSLPIQNSLLGNYNELFNTKHQKARVFCANSSITLDRTQRLAVEHAMRKRISLIEGVAGSGKSLVAASIAYSMKRFRGSKVLLCSPMQATVDHLAKMLAEDGPRANVVKLPNDEQKSIRNHRFGKDDDELFDDEDTSARPIFDAEPEQRPGEYYALDTLVNRALYLRRYKRSLGARQPVKISGKKVFYHSRSHSIARKQARRFVHIASPWLRRKEECKALSKADIVCCTLSQAGSARLRDFSFDILIIDDAHAAMEADCVVAMMVKGIKQVALISDMRRGIRLARAESRGNSKLTDLDNKSDTAIRSPAAKMKRANTDPYIRLRRMSSANSNTNKPNGIVKDKLTAKQDHHLGPGGLFERWLSMGLSAVVLKYQFRMHETLAALPNYHFYLSKLKTNKVISEGLNREIMSDLVLGEDSFSWLPEQKCLTALYICTKETTSSVEDTTQEIIDKLIQRENIHKSRIGILTNNRADTTIPQAKYEGVRIGTVEDYFGSEKDFMVLSCKDFESIDNASIDDEKPISMGAIQCNFLKSDTALLIALTRARLGLFIVADKSICYMDSEENDDKKNHDKSKFCQSWKALVSYYKNNKIIKC